MAKIEYPAEVWARLREVWETSPKITWDNLVKQVGDELACDMPSGSVVRRKSLTEKWKKRAKGLVKKNARELNKEIKKLTSDLTSQNDGHEESQDADIEPETDSQEPVKNQSEIVVRNGQNRQSYQEKTNTPVSQLTAAMIIKKNRARLADLGDLAGDTITSVIHIRDEVINLDLEGLDAEATELALNKIKFKMGLINQVVELNMKQSITLSNIAKAESIFWGLELEDLKDQSEVQARRTAVIDDSAAKLAAARQQMALKKKEAFRRKLAIIEAGDYDPENDVPEEDVA